MTVRQQDRSGKRPNKRSHRIETGIRQGGAGIFLDRDGTLRGEGSDMPDLITENLFGAVELILQEMGRPKDAPAFSSSCRS